MVLSGNSHNGRLTEIIELPDHPFFIAGQFHPELRSRPTRPHPLFREFVGAAQTHPPRTRGAHRHRQLTSTGDGGAQRGAEPVRVQDRPPLEIEQWPGDRRVRARAQPPRRRDRSPHAGRRRASREAVQATGAVRTLTEIPAGLLDVEGEDALTCAARELFEETGYRHRAIEFLGGYYASPGFTDEYVHLFLARTAAEPEGAPEDGIEVSRMPFVRPSRPRDGEGCATCSTALALLLAAERVSLA